VPTTLAIDCVGTACSVALFSDGALTAQEHIEIGRGHAERLVPLIAGFPNEGKADRIAVNAGPGSFTGVRIGVSVARALGLAWGAEVVGYSALDLTVALAMANGNNSALCVVLHGGHGEFFVQNYDVGGIADGAFASLTPEEVMMWAQGRDLVGNAAAAPTLSAMGLVGETINLRAADFALLNADRLSHANPHYGRAPDAAISVRR
jgi:tRNA threonylcarbamoyladenosine biosynthesis protein TsaB